MPGDFQGSKTRAGRKIDEQVWKFVFVTLKEMLCSFVWNPSFLAFAFTQLIEILFPLKNSSHEEMTTKPSLISVRCQDRFPTDLLVTSASSYKTWSKLSLAVWPFVLNCLRKTLLIERWRGNSVCYSQFEVVSQAILSGLRNCPLVI